MTEELRKMGPLSAEHPLTHHSGHNNICPACEEYFKAGDYVTLIVLGPGNDPEAREKARNGVFYNAVASAVHWACATGEEVD